LEGTPERKPEKNALEPSIGNTPEDLGGHPGETPGRRLETSPERVPQNLPKRRLRNT